MTTNYRDVFKKVKCYFAKHFLTAFLINKKANI
jgi:hypothetical protein